MELNTIYQEPCLETLANMPDESIDCVITSPPYWQLRDYGYEGQWGLEPTFQLYLEHLWSMMDEIYRVLKPDGTVWINLGDTYGGGSGVHESATAKKHGGLVGNLPSKGGISKCLLLIPHRFAIGCIDPDYELRKDLTDEEKLFVISELEKYGL